jgi:hypothetical protein
MPRRSPTRAVKCGKGWVSVDVGILDGGRALGIRRHLIRRFRHPDCRAFESVQSTPRSTCGPASTTVTRAPGPPGCKRSTRRQRRRPRSAHRFARPKDSLQILEGAEAQLSGPPGTGRRGIHSGNPPHQGGVETSYLGQSVQLEKPGIPSVEQSSSQPLCRDRRRARARQARRRDAERKSSSMHVRAASAGRSAKPVAVRDHRRNRACNASGVGV